MTRNVTFKLKLGIENVGKSVLGREQKLQKLQGRKKAPMRHWGGDKNDIGESESMVEFMSTDKGKPLKSVMLKSEMI